MEEKTKTTNKSREQRRRELTLLRGFLKGSWLMFGVSILMAALTALADMISPQIIRAAVDNAIGGKTPSYSPWIMSLVDSVGGFAYLGQHLWIMAAAVLAVALVKVISQYVYRVSNTKASETMVKTMRDSLFGHIERLPFEWHMKNRTGDIIQRCTSDIDTTRNFVSEQLSSILRIVIMLALSMVFMFRMNVLLTVIALIPMPTIVWYAAHFRKILGEGFRACDESEGKLSAMAQENLTGVRVVRAFGRERYERDRFEAHNEEYTSSWVKLAGASSRFWASSDVLSGIQVMLVVVFGAVFAVRGSITPGEYIAFISYNGMLSWPIRMLGNVVSEMSKAGVSVERIAEIMAAEPEHDEPGAQKADMTGDIAFEHVNFAYGGGPPVLRDIDFTMKAGTTLGILGGTGSGKSTMMLLLDKLYELKPEDGRITIGGVDINDIDTAHLRQNIGMVLQEPYLFSRTLAENIGIADPSITLEQIREASRSACLDDTVEGFTKGYDTFVGERGVTLSGGQKQRAAIARALTRNTPIMIFDDSLSAVDTETDARIRAALEKRFGSASIILISHRITTLSKADQILVLDRGRIAERGTHEELKHAGGIYQQIYEIQSGSGEEAAV